MAYTRPDTSLFDVNKLTQLKNKTAKNITHKGDPPYYAI
jgi:hypothetical protein